MATLKNRRSPWVVFGTTPDYVEKIYHRDRRETFFVVDAQHRQSPCLETVDPEALFFADLGNIQNTIQPLIHHFVERNISPLAMACFDCESLLAASVTALELGLTFPLPGPVSRARNKFESRSLWRKAGLLSPSAVLASSFRQTLSFFHAVHHDIVIKPIAASGSELLFHCTSEDEVLDALEVLKVQLSARRSHPLFRPMTAQFKSAGNDPCASWIAEEYVPGPEFSCDFIYREGTIEIVRVTGKVRDPSQPFGTVTAYTLPPHYPSGFTTLRIKPILIKAVRSLGFQWGYFMADFILHDSQPVVIELSPRPGGDAIPDLVETAIGIDLLGLYLDFASGRWPVPLPGLHPSQPMAAVNFYAPKEGVISELDMTPIYAFPWVRKVFKKMEVHDRIILPPWDYDSRKIGYCIIDVEPSWDLVQVQQLLQKNMTLSVIDTENMMYPGLPEYLMRHAL